MKGLATLIRLHKLKLTDQQRRLAALQAVAQGFLGEIEALDRASRDEARQAAGNPETGHTLGAFIQASIARRATIEASLADVEREMAEIRDSVSAAFRELKRYELIEEKRRKDAKRIQQRRERRIEDEIGMSVYRRKKQSAGG